jgi:hypothetical protein
VPTVAAMRSQYRRCRTFSTAACTLRGVGRSRCFSRYPWAKRWRRPSSRLVAELISPSRTLRAPVLVAHARDVCPFTFVSFLTTGAAASCLRTSRTRVPRPRGRQLCLWRLFLGRPSLLLRRLNKSEQIALPSGTSQPEFRCRGRTNATGSQRQMLAPSYPSCQRSYG